jgi:hypothetical protein
MRVLGICIASVLLVAGLAVADLGLGWLSALLCAGAVILILLLLFRLPRQAS